MADERIGKGKVTSVFCVFFRDVEGDYLEAIFSMESEAEKFKALKSDFDVSEEKVYSSCEDAVKDHLCEATCPGLGRCELLRYHAEPNHLTNGQHWTSKRGY